MSIIRQIRNETTQNSDDFTLLQTLRVYFCCLKLVINLLVVSMSDLYYQMYSHSSHIVTVTEFNHIVAVSISQPFVLRWQRWSSIHLSFISLVTAFLLRKKTFENVLIHYIHTYLLCNKVLKLFRERHEYNFHIYLCQILHILHNSTIILCRKCAIKTL